MQNLFGAAGPLLWAVRACRAPSLRQNFVEFRAMSAELRVNFAAKRAPETPLTFAHAADLVQSMPDGGALHFCGLCARQPPKSR